MDGPEDLRRLPIAYRLLISALSPASIRDSLIDDLEEEFTMEWHDHGAHAARRWLRAQLRSTDWLHLRAAHKPHTDKAPRPTRGEPVMQSLIFDVAYALRRVRQQPRFSVAVILTVAVGILGAATVLGAVDAVLLQPLPFPEGDRLVSVQGFNDEMGRTGGPVSLVNLTEWGELDVFDGVFAVQGVAKVLSGNGPPQGLIAARLSPQALGVLGIEPHQGRGFRDDEAVTGNDRVVMLSYALWRERFEADPAVVGERVLLDSIPYEVVGVLPEDATLPTDLAFNIQRDIWIPLAPEPEEFPRGRRATSGHGRLADGVSMEAAQAAIDALFASQTELDPEANEGWAPRVRSVVDTMVGPFRNVLRLMMGAALMLVVLACVNLINLMLAQGTARRAEFSIRTALGAARRRIVTQLLAEGVVLGVLGGLVGLLATTWVLAAFTRWTPGNVPRLDEAAMNPFTAALVLSCAAVVGLIFGGVPATLLTSRSHAAHTRDTAGASSSRWERRFVGTLVGVQVALAVVLLIGASLLGRSFVNLLGVDTGFETDNVLVTRVVLAPPTYPGHADRTRFVREALESFAALPGVDSVGVTNFLPYSGNNTRDGFDIRDREPTQQQRAGFRAVDPGYLDVLQLRVVHGRALTSSDMGATPGALVNQSLADKYFGDDDPLGSFIQRDEGWVQIVGVVADVRHEGPQSVPEPEWYAPFAYDPYPLKAFVLRTSVPAANVAPLLRDALAELDPQLAPLDVQTMNDYLDEHLASPRFNAATLGAFALVAIIIAAQGVFGVMAHAVARRSREMGIRKALGANPRRLRNRIVGEGLILAAAGVVVGLLATIPLLGFLESLLLDVSPSDPATFVAVAVFVLSVAALACFLPARRAARVDPLVVLRGD